MGKNDRKNWRLLTENVVRAKWEEETYNGNDGQLTPDDSDAKNTIPTKYSLTLD